MCMYVCVSGYDTYMGVTMKIKRMSWSPRAGIAGNPEVPDTMLATELDSLEGQKALLTTELSL